MTKSHMIPSQKRRRGEEEKDNPLPQGPKDQNEDGMKREDREVHIESAGTQRSYP